MKKWDIWWAPIPEGKRHPVVILSSTVACSDPTFKMVNVLVGVTKRPGMPEDVFHFALNGTDGLEHRTLFDCYLIQPVLKSKLTEYIGSVGYERRKKMMDLVVAILKA